MNVSKKAAGLVKAAISSSIISLSGLWASTVLAQLQPDVPGTRVVTGAGEPRFFLDTARGIVRYAYFLFFILAVLFILIAAYNYLTAAGNQEKVDRAKTMLIYAAVAIAVALVAITLSTLIFNFLGAPTTTPLPQ